MFFPFSVVLLCQWKFWSRKRARGQDGVVGERSKRMDGENVGQWVATVESENWVKLYENQRRRFFFAHPWVTESNSKQHWGPADHADYSTYPAQSASNRLWWRADRRSNTFLTAHKTFKVLGSTTKWWLMAWELSSILHESPHDPTTDKHTSFHVRTWSSSEAADLVFGLGYAESYGAAQHTNFCVCVSLLSNPLYV